MQENGEIVVFWKRYSRKNRTRPTHVWVDIYMSMTKPGQYIYKVVARSGWEVKVGGAWHTMAQSDRKATEKWDKTTR